MPARLSRLAAIVVIALVGSAMPALADHHPQFGDIPDASPAPAAPAAATPAAAAKPAAKPGVAKLPSKSETRLLANEVLVETKLDIAPADLAAIAKRNHLTLIETADNGLLVAKVHRFHIDDGRPVRAVLLGLNAERLVLLAQPNYSYTLTQAATPAAAPVPQYAADLLHLPAVHALATGRAVKIGILDTGIADPMAELAGSVALRFDATGQPPADDLSHGTAVAGIVAAHVTLQGVAPAATLLSARAFVAADGQPPGSNSFVLLKGFDWLASSGAQIVNMSFAGPADPLFSKELKAAHDKGILAVAAAGNDGPKAAPDFPAADPNVIGVTAVDDADAVLPEANQGGYIAVSAPGVDVLVLAPDGSYVTDSGTSMAAPHVAGIAALLLEHDPTLTPDALAKLLTGTADDLGKKGKDKVFGAGLVDPQKALTSKP